MLKTTVTHYWPWNEPDDVAWCGAPMTEEMDAHSPTPTCPACAAKLAIEDALEVRLAEEAMAPLTDDDARYAGVALRQTVVPVVEAVAFTLRYARAARGGRR